jgi:protein tyrosine/serine phosphatase
VATKHKKEKSHTWQSFKSQLQPVGLSESDKNTLLKDYHLKKIIDFRSQQEVVEKPC